MKIDHAAAVLQMIREYRAEFGTDPPCIPVTMEELFNIFPKASPILYTREALEDKRIICFGVQLTLYEEEGQ